ncbi:MAG: ankyrin repeat domain-containing protein [gamma proteobacterium endosymbiont of Lamellibrachia anaximandri]|nr:ankyrin repeat domain-containing protein [gamma proteobacterium endosymbiont of Lamellibrachia anaximandri]
MYRSLLLLASLTLFLTACSQQEPVFESDNPPLITAAEKGNMSELDRLLSQDSTIDVVDACHWTPLMKAALNGHAEAVERLLDAGADVNLTDKGGYSAVMLAASNNHARVVRLLLKQGANIDQVESTGGWTALIWAAKLGHGETVETLLTHRANPGLRDLKGRSALDWAHAQEHQAIIERLSERG